MTPSIRHDEVVTARRPSGAITRLLRAELAVAWSTRSARIVCVASVVLAGGALLAHLSATAGLEPGARVRIAVNAASVAPASPASCRRPWITATTSSSNAC